MRIGDGVEFDVGGIDVAMSVEVSRSVVVRAGAVVVAVIIDVTNSVDIGVGAVTTAVTIIVLKAAEEEESISAVIAKVRKR